MSKYLSVAGGIIAIALGILGLARWWDPEMLYFFKAILVMLLIFGGLLAFVAGAAEIKDSSADKSEKKQQGI